MDFQLGMGSMYSKKLPQWVSLDFSTPAILSLRSHESEATLNEKVFNAGIKPKVEIDIQY